MNIVQFVADDRRALAVVEDGRLRRLRRYSRLYDLAWSAIERNIGLQTAVEEHLDDRYADFDEAIVQRRVLSPIDHPDPAHMLITGTGLSHLGSAATRDQMHADLDDESSLTDSMKMFKWGLQGGRPAPGEVGVQPEWFYKGDGSIATAPEADLISPAFALDGGEEPEIAGIYLIGPDAAVYRLGFALANEFSDHVTEQQNYLYLAHSKLRPCSFGPELLVGVLPDHIEGTSAIVRAGETIWSKPFLSGNANMCHAIENLEHHHFKYRAFRRPGDVHVHFFGTATLSFADRVETRDGDTFVIEAAPFGRPLRNRLRVAAPEVFERRVL